MACGEKILGFPSGRVIGHLGAGDSGGRLISASIPRCNNDDKRHMARQNSVPSYLGIWLKLWWMGVQLRQRNKCIRPAIRKKKEKKEKKEKRNRKKEPPPTAKKSPHDPQNSPKKHKPARKATTTGYIRALNSTPPFFFCLGRQVPLIHHSISPQHFPFHVSGQSPSERREFPHHGASQTLPELVPTLSQAQWAQTGCIQELWVHELYPRV